MAQKLDERPGSQYEDDWKPGAENTDNLEDSFNAPSATDEDLPEGHPDRSKKASSPDELAEGESSGGTPDATEADNKEAEKLGTDDADENDEGWYKKGDKKGNAKRLFTRRRVIALGAFSALGGGGVAILFLIFPALRLENYMQRINQRAFALAASGVESRTEHLFDRYMIGHILSLQSCTTVSSIDCKADYGSSGLAAGLFNTWRDARAEAKILDRMGFSIESTRNPSQANGIHKFTLRDARTGGSITFTNIEGWDTFKAGKYEGGSRELGRNIRRELKVALAGETRWRQMMDRRSIRKYLSRKHGINLWCFFACKTRDSIELKTADAKTRYKYRFIERFVYPFSAKYGFIMNCIMQGGNCKATDTQKQLLDRSRVPDEDIAKIVNDFKNPDGSFKQQRLFTYSLQRLLEKMGINKALASKSVAAIPIAGQIYLGAWAFDLLYRMDGFIENKGLSKFAADINASQYLEYYSGLRSFNDEMKSGDASFDEVGAVMTDFDGAEQSRVYKAYNSSPGSSASLLGQKAYAQAALDSDYKCDDGDPIPVGDHVCEEKKVARTFLLEDVRGNGVIDGLSDGLFGSYETCFGVDVPGGVPVVSGCKGIRPKTVVQGVLKTVDSVSESIFGPVFDAVISVASSTPGLSSLVSFMEEKSSELIHHIFGLVFPLPVDIDSPGREKYDGLEAGADVASSQFGQGGYTDSGDTYGLGAPPISDTETTKVLQEYFDQQDFEFKNSGFFARLTDKDNPRSLASQMILKTPSGTQGLPQNIASAFFGIFRNIANTFSLIFASNVGAQSGAEQQIAINAFGVTRYGYGVDDPVFTRDPAELTEATCEEYKQQRLASVTENELTGFEEYAVTDPCLLEEVVVEAAGAYFRDD